MKRGEKHGKPQHQQQQQGGRGGKPLHQGGPSKPGHLRPEIDARDPTGGKHGEIAQNRQQSSGQGSGQS
ncbi:MAG TPA: hypothetical protein VLI41_12505 [Phenylobacterium sp.]|uniref:hypothetical protein n=1 Tax=Phenylobacterium sp. TaxID=1871053 RepID=UPI002BF18E33|nr:hypothetical protein [Phenylobacterium sp.]HSV04016.1 hypothetical protein [Phenylobacterium sp.]